MKTKYLIIGGGISGLTFANYVKDYVIIEIIRRYNRITAGIFNQLMVVGRKVKKRLS